MIHEPVIYVVNIWEARKIKLYYGDDPSQSSAGDVGEVTGD